jgi:hypothetical protein
MKIFFSFAVVLSCFLITTTIAHALRCGSNLISLGDLKNEVRVKCGEPKSTEIIGYIDHVENEKRIRVMKIEEWILEIKTYGSIYYHSLVFEGNKLIEIKPAGKKN